MPKPARKAPDKPLGALTFACGTCRVEGKAYTFHAAPARTVDAPDQEHHLFEYFASCPSCKAECAQASWERALLKAWANATGPKTPEGKAATAKNLEGHPTAEESRRTRFNAMKNGLHARVATYFPSKPDGYAFCSSCTVDREYCAKQPACVMRTENFLRHHAAFDQRNPAHLKEIYADMQAAITEVMQQCLQTIIAEGVRLKSPMWYSDKDGGLHMVAYNDTNGAQVQVYEFNSHPLIKSVAELMKATGLSLADMGMTAKLSDAVEDAELGQLGAAGGGQKALPKESIEAYQARIAGAMEGLRERVERAGARADQDPVLLEYNKEAGAYVPPAGKP